MKKILSVMFALFSATAMYAQSHGNHLMLGLGVSYPQGVETTRYAQPSSFVLPRV